MDRMRQLALAEPPIARTTDPSTSHRAAAVITKSGRRSIDREILLSAICDRPSLTSMELAQVLIDAGHLWLRAYQIASKRINDLVKAGLIESDGERRCCVSRHDARTWIATAAAHDIELPALSVDRRCWNPDCDEKLTGRTDQEYCSPSCRAAAWYRRHPGRRINDYPALAAKLKADMDRLVDFFDGRTNKPSVPPKLSLIPSQMALVRSNYRELGVDYVGAGRYRYRGYELKEVRVDVLG